MIASLLSPDFVSDLGIEKKALEAFIDILKKEENALVQGKIDEIDHLVTDKSHLIEKLLQIDDRRNKYFHNQGISSDNVSIWLKEHFTDRSKAHTLWHDVLELAKIAKELSHTNGLMISTYLQQNQRGFGALHCAAGNISLYGPKGQTYI